MKVFLSTLGSAGDIVTFARLAAALAARGHAVTVHTWQSYVSWFPPTVRTVASAADVTPAALHQALSAALAFASPWAQIRVFSRCFYGLGRGTEHAQRAYRSAIAAAEGSDIAVCNVLDQLGQAAVETLGIPWLSWASRPPPDPAHIDGPDALGPLDAELQALVRAVSGRPADHVRTFRTRSPHGDLAACSPALAPAFTGDPALTMTGAWLDPDASTAELEPSLAAFLDAGSALLITFGTLPDSHGRTEALIEAALRANWRVVTQVLPPSPAPAPRDGLHVARGRLSYPTLFARGIRAVVHHGGAGTLHEIVRAGLPSVAMPHISDQYFWARRAHEAGLGPAPLVAGERDRAALRARLAALRHRRYTQAATSLGAALATEDGVMTTVRHLEAHVGDNR